jgi:hypothetical protein
MKPLFHTAIYVNRRPKELKEKSHGQAPSDWLAEGRRWTSGANLLREARDAGCELPLIFGYYAPLTYWAVARGIKVLKKTTAYRFANLQRIRGGQERKSLTVVTSKKPLPNDYIRSYAIIMTPNFLRPKSVLNQGNDHSVVRHP